jgi:sugar O-acyltransferase (sialic acid O-acetyltransferase NeuD family)
MDLKEMDRRIFTLPAFLYLEQNIVMLIIGTGGLASDILSSIQLDHTSEDLCFYNDTTTPPKKYISANYRVITSLQEAGEYFAKMGTSFILGVGENTIRKNLADKFESIGGVNITYISSRALIGKHVSVAAKGAIIMHHAVIGNGSEIGTGSIIYCNASLGHSSIIGDYVLVSGNVCMSATEIGSYSTIGIGVNFKPGVTIGDHAFIGTGSVVAKDIRSGYIAYGNPAKEIKKSSYHVLTE